MSKMNSSPSRTKAVSDRQAVSLHEAVDKIMRRFKLEPGMLAGSVYADLHVNDVGLLAVLGAPFSTVSSALDRLEKRSLVARLRRSGDRRVVYIKLSASGIRLAERLRATQIETCRAMLAELPVRDRDELIRLVVQVARR